MSQHNPLEKVPLEVLIEELGSRFAEMVVIGRIRPKVLGPGAAPQVISGGKGDLGDQLGLVASFEHNLKMNHSREQQLAFMRALNEEAEADANRLKGGPR